MHSDTNKHSEAAKKSRDFKRNDQRAPTPWFNFGVRLTFRSIKIGPPETLPARPFKTGTPLVHRNLQ
jgi:hypothetical protein